MIPSEKQRSWEWPAVANFTLGGVGAGFYLFNVVVLLYGRGISALMQPTACVWISPVMMGLGFVLLTLEAGRPFRGHLLLSNLRRSWISRETAAFILFILGVGLDQLFPGPLFKCWAAMAALLFVISQGFIVYAERAMVAWNVPLMPFYFLSSGFSSGAGVALMLSTSGQAPAPIVLGVTSMIAVMITSAIWLGYLKGSTAVEFQSATHALRQPRSLGLTLGVGGLLPVLLMLYTLSPPGPPSPSGKTAFAAGLSIIIGVTLQKIAIIRSAGATHEISL